MMYRLAGIISVLSAITLVLGFADVATAVAQAMVAVFSLGVVAFIATATVMIGEALAGRNLYRFPPPG